MIPCHRQLIFLLEGSRCIGLIFTPVVIDFTAITFRDFRLAFSFLVEI